MNQVPVIPESAPFTADQRAWLNGFIAGLFSRGELPAFVEETRGSKTPLLILYGSQSGTAEGLAKQLNKQAAAKGFNSRVSGMDAVDIARLPEETNVLIITSTWGEGDMPDNAAGFWDALNRNGSSPVLEGMQYSVLALGDMAYADTFCLAGKKLDVRLQELGARRVHPRVDCDVDYEEPARRWSEGVFTVLLGTNAVLPEGLGPSETEPADRTEVDAGGYSKKRPFPAKLLANDQLTGAGSGKDTRHFVFSLEGSGLSYETGDALGVHARNCPEVVEAVIAAHGLDAAEEVSSPDGEALPLREALLRHYEVRTLLGVGPKARLAAKDFLGTLRKLQPRLYSIASSPKAHPREVHLCVDVVRYESNGIRHKGVASSFLAARLALGEKAGVFVHVANHFRPPDDPAAPMIMVGPGTGIAPFRAFLQERQALQASGPNWLFFGAQHRKTDFLYEREITAWFDDGLLTRLDLAFSRDQPEKVYVQHLMHEKANEIWDWLEQGAHFYVCGDASKMAKDVDLALHNIIQTAGGKGGDKAAAYVAEMRKTKRYCRDVY